MRTGGDIQVARNNNRKVVPEARAALDQMKYEVAGQVGVKERLQRRPYLQGSRLYWRIYGKEND
jgi:hypothetical protein